MKPLLAVALACVPLAAQTAETAPAFDVASFKRYPPGESHGGAKREADPKRLMLHNATLGLCIRWAFGYEHFQVVGPNWRDYPTDVVYEVDARTSSPTSREQMALMLQRLLKERLGLVYHIEKRDLPIYALVVAKGGPKFQKSTTEGDPKISSGEGPYTMRFEHYSMALLVERLLQPPVTSRHTSDETGLAGNYDFTFDEGRYVLDAEGKPILDGRGAIDMESAFIQGLPAQLGLRLEKKTAPFDVFVVDRVEKDPTGN